MEAWKITNDSFDSTKCKICNVEHTNNCQGKSTSLEIHRKWKRGLGRMENGKRKIMELEKIIKEELASEKNNAHGVFQVLPVQQYKIAKGIYCSFRTISNLLCMA